MNRRRIRLSIPCGVRQLDPMRFHWSDWNRGKALGARCLLALRAVEVGGFGAILRWRAAGGGGEGGRGRPERAGAETGRGAGGGWLLGRDLGREAGSVREVPGWARRRPRSCNGGRNGARDTHTRGCTAETSTAISARAHTDREGLCVSVERACSHGANLAIFGDARRKTHEEARQTRVTGRACNSQHHGSTTTRAVACTRCPPLRVQVWASGRWEFGAITHKTSQNQGNDGSRAHTTIWSPVRTVCVCVSSC